MINKVFSGFGGFDTMGDEKLTRLSSIARSLVIALLATFLSIGPWGSITPASALSRSDFGDGNCNLVGAPGYLGDGTSGDPFQISDSDSLWETADCSRVQSLTYFRVINDIVIPDNPSMPDEFHSPIGFSTSGVITFSGVLDGGGFAISNISITTQSSVLGLFAELSDATITNLEVGGAVGYLDGIRPSGFAQNGVGLLSGLASGPVTISNVIARGVANGGGENTGGLIGYAASTVALISVSSDVDIEAVNFVGGLIGQAAGGADISNSKNTGEILGEHCIGGLVGATWIGSKLTISDSENSRRVSSSGSVTDGYAGGLVGCSYDDLVVTNSTNTGTVSGFYHAGGIVGFSNNVSLASVSNNAVITAANNASGEGTGGLIGVVDIGFAATISDSANSAEVTGGSIVGGLLGNSLGTVSITRSQNHATVSGSNVAGGLAGEILGTANVTGSSNSGETSGIYRVGGLIGNALSALEVDSSINQATVSGTSYIGGLAGRVSGELLVTGSTNSGDVEGGDTVGGIVGYASESATLEYAANLGSIRAFNQIAGGLVGQADSNLTISRSFNVATISSIGARAGGLAANADVSGSVVNIFESFNSGDVDASDDVAGLIGVGPTVNIQSSFNSGAAYAPSGNYSRAAGLLSTAQSATITNSYNVGSVAASNVDGIAYQSGISVTNSFAIQSSNYSAATTTDAQLKLQSTFTNFGWNFDDVWTISSTINTGYPAHRWLYTASQVISSPSNPNQSQNSSYNFNDLSCDLSVGTGSEDSPYVISSSEELWESVDCSFTNSQAAYFSISNDIDLSDPTSAPTQSPIGFISTESDPVSFSGTIFGNGHSITNISMSSSIHGVGLFTHVDSATISQLLIEGSLVGLKDDDYEFSSVGGLIMYASGRIVLDSVQSNMIIEGSYDVGGLIGWADGDVEISNASNSGSVSGIDYVGGLVGYSNQDVSISDSINRADITGEDSVGGLLGDSWDVWIRNSENLGSVEGDDYVGGVVGDASSLYLLATSNSGEVRGDDSIGGIAGYVSDPSELLQVNNSATVSASGDYVGGLIGSAGDLDLIESTNSGRISGLDSVGGAVGVAGTLSASSLTNEGSVSGQQDNVGGLVGYCDVLLVQESTNSGQVTGAQNVGGLAGQVALTSDIADSLNSGDITADDKVGSMIGWAQSQATHSAIANSGLVVGQGDFVGGFYGLIGPVPAAPSSPFVPAAPTVVNTPSPTPSVLAADIPKANLGGLVTIVGVNLASVYKVLIEGQEATELRVSDTEISFRLPATTTSGSKTVQFIYPTGSTTLVAKLEVIESEKATNSTSSRVNVASFNGSVVIYLAGLIGETVSWKIAGKWYKAKITKNFQVFQRRIGAIGRPIGVNLYIGGELRLSRQITTR